MTPLITIGIPFYNAEKFLSQAILSVLNQTYQDWELILLDDGSSDTSLSIARKFTDTRIKVISDGKNRGLVYRLNQLSRMAQGCYYARMDADDIMHPKRLEQQINFLESTKNVDVVGSGYYSIDENNNIAGKYIANKNLDNIQSLLKNGGFVHPSIMGRTDWFIQNPYNSDMERMEDFELWLRTIEKSSFYNINDALLFYRTEETSTYKKYVRTNINIIKLLKNKQANITKFDRMKQQFYFTIKIAIYSLFELIQSTEFLVKKRLTGMSTQEKEMALSYLKEALYEK
ncbi:MAG: hypothetical protein BGO29_10790 [Bacteroidales bacterium 36-12]|nr:MAG: hypothetical protein BGO29_10790 [Bacteroidales bacterium 36-12]